MALIKCPDCGQTVSDKTITCLKCGRPIAGTAGPANTPGAPIQTIEKTSKKLKGRLLICYVAFFVSLFIGMICGASESTTAAGIAGFLILGSIVGVVVTKMQIWWEHE